MKIFVKRKLKIKDISFHFKKLEKKFRKLEPKSVKVNNKDKSRN